MDEMYGGKSSSNKIIKLSPLIISVLFVILALCFLPGTFVNKTKYVKKDDPNSELTLRNMTTSVILLTFTILLIIGGILLQLKTVKQGIGMTEIPP